jgi:hypothetical protein
MKIHQFRMHEIEWTGYLLNFRTNLFLEPDQGISTGDIVILSECIYVTGNQTGRHLAFKIKNIDLMAGSIEDMIFWNCSLTRLKEYNIEQGLQELKQQLRKQLPGSTC